MVSECGVGNRQHADSGERAQQYTGGKQKCFTLTLDFVYGLNTGTWLSMS
jgi:hypothetical protein